MTQQSYLQWMANVCGDRLPTSATGQDYINWAREKGMNPAGGWQLNAKLTKQVVAQTLVQLLNLAPRKGTFDAIRILEREGINISSGDGYVNQKSLVALIDSGLPSRAGNSQGHGRGHGNDNDNDQGEDEDHRPTGTKSGNGNGDDNHEHTGPPGHTGIHPGKGGGRGPH